MKKLTLTLMLFLLTALGMQARKAVPHTTIGRPDLEAIQSATTNPESDMYYQSLLKKFMANDTSMTDEQFQYFYYGTLFQEDYDPYRKPARPDMLAKVTPVYVKDKRSRAERQMMLDYALAVLEDNPVNLRQLVNRVYVYEQNGKYDLARIWQYKLNHLLLVIASSGNGTDAENARVVVYPEYEYDFLNLSGLTAVSQRFEAPHYDYIEVSPRKGGDGETTGYYFDISEMLHQYFLKHPSELQDDTPGEE